MINFFSTAKYKIYRQEITPKGAGDTLNWVECRSIKAYVEPINGEKLLISETGKQSGISLIIYSRELINTGERIYIPYSDKNSCWFEIQQCEFYKLPFFSYYKGYLVKIDENMHI